MRKYITIIIILLCFRSVVYAQNSNYQINLKGNTKATINGSTDVINIVIPVGSSIKESIIKVSHPADYFYSGQNGQTASSYDVTCNSNNFNRVEETDIYGNKYSKFTQTSPITTTVTVQQFYSATTEALLTNGFTSTASFPVTNVPANILTDYTWPTTNIQSNDPAIRNKAVSLTSGCTQLQDAVQKISQWVIGSITYKTSTNNNLDMTASLVFSRNPKSGNCAGYTNLIIAMLRSVGIPARYISGVILKYQFSVSNNIFVNPIPMGSSASGSHAEYEVYYPDKGEWVMADPQSSLNFSSTNFVRHQQVPDVCDKPLLYINAPYTGNMPTVSQNDMCGSITSFTNNFAVDGYSVFQSASPNKTLLSVYPGLTTGINDKIAITTGTRNFKTGEKVNYYSTFTSSGGNTWPTNRFWSIELYHTNGTYLYASDNNNNNFWDKTTTPVLPDYQWLLDANGRIFGEVTVSATLNDGDMVAAKMPLSIERCNGVVVSNQTYTSNTTIIGCYVTMDNINVQNNSALIVDTEMGMTINNNFTVNAGSTFETK